MILSKPKTYQGSFTSLSNKTLRDADLTDGSFRLLVFLLTMSREYKPSESGLAKRFGVSTRTMVNRVAELRKKGYLRIETFRSKGQKSEQVWIVSEFPIEVMKSAPP